LSSWNRYDGASRSFQHGNDTSGAFVGIITIKCFDKGYARNSVRSGEPDSMHDWPSSKPSEGYEPLSSSRQKQPIAIQLRTMYLVSAAHPQTYIATDVIAAHPFPNAFFPKLYIAFEELLLKRRTYAMLLAELGLWTLVLGAAKLVGALQLAQPHATPVNNLFQANGWSPKPTSNPKLPVEIFRRQDSEFCGFLEGSPRKF